MSFSLLSWLRSQAVAERTRWPLWLPVLLGTGIGLYFALPLEPPLIMGWGAAGVFAGAASVFSRRNRIGWAVLAVGMCALSLGVGLAGLRTWWVAAPVLARDIGPLDVSGQVAEVEARANGYRVTLEHLNIERLAPDVTPLRVRITLMGTQPPFEAGDWLRVLAKLSPPSEPAAPGAFDFQRQSYFEGIGGIGFALGPARVVGRAPQSGVSSATFALNHLRSQIAARVRAQVPGAAGEVAAALTTGARGAIPQEVLDDMRASGLAHLLAISGLHVGLVAGIVFFAVRAALALSGALALRYPIKKWAAVCALCGALFYALIAGATVPTQRAFLMVALVLAAVLADRQALSMRAVAWAALAILMLSPEALLGASFQLSFAAVVALIAAYEAVRRHPRLRAWFQGGEDGEKRGRLRRLGGYVLGVALTTLVAGLATSTFAAFHFNRVADYSLAANIVAVPLTALWIMPWAVAGFVLMPLGWEGLALAPMGWGIEAVLAVARTVASWPGSQTLMPAFPTWGLALFAFGGLWAALWRGRWRLLGTLPAVLGIASVFWMEVPDVLIDASGQLAAVKTPEGGYSLSTLRSKRFERDVWLRRAGLEREDGRWSTAQVGLEQFVRCDGQGCVYSLSGGGARSMEGPPHAERSSVSFVYASEALAEDCMSARVVVNLSPAALPQNAPCAAEIHIGLADLRKNGAHALYFQKGGQVRLETVRQKRGNRPWVLNTQ